MEDYHAYLEKLRLERIEKDRRSLERWNETKKYRLQSQLKSCDIQDLSDGIVDLLDFRKPAVYKTLLTLLAENYTEGVDYRLQRGAYDNKVRYKLKVGIGIRLAGLYLKWSSPMRQRASYVTIMKIKRAYKDAVSKREFEVPTDTHTYRVDLYFPGLKIAVECDEQGHRGRDPNYELRRQAAIEEKMGCKFLRYNPDARGFDIDNVIRELGVMIEEARANVQESDDSESEDGASSESEEEDTDRITGHLDPGWLNIMPSRRHYDKRLWYLTPYGEKVWPYEVPYGIYPPNGYVKPNPMLPRPPGAGVADPDLIRREAIAANRYGRGPWPGLPDDSPIKYWLVAECNLPGSTKPVILGTITGRLIKTYE